MLKLTKRQTQVARLAAQGYTNQQIALELDVTIMTVKNHLDSAYRRLGFKEEQSNRNPRVLLAIYWATVVDPPPKPPAPDESRSQAQIRSLSRQVDCLLATNERLAGLLAHRQRKEER